MDADFTALGVTRQFVDALHDMGISQPTEIQLKSLKPALAGQDLLGIAETGSGKTLAFLLPVALKLKFSLHSYPVAIILAPSKELVVQIFSVWKALTIHTDLKAACLYGGVGKKQQIATLEGGVDLLISTPGRLLDLYSYGHIFLRKVHTLVLDEADRMMEMGFMPQLRSILEILPVKRQNLLFSATFPDKVKDMAAEFLEFPTLVESDAHGQPVSTVKQMWYAVPNFRTKLLVLEQFLSGGAERVMVFCRSRDGAERVSKYLARKHPDAVRVLHANKGQHTRINAMDAFRNGEIQVLVTTDVSSRGIDVEGVSHVINFDVPRNVEDYLHRIGRTARVHREGTAITLANAAEEQPLAQIEQHLDAPLLAMELPEGVEKAPDLPGERKDILRAIDIQKRKADPSFKGAFHDKKRKGSPPTKDKAKSKTRKRKGR